MIRVFLWCGAVIVGMAGFAPLPGADSPPVASVSKPGPARLVMVAVHQANAETLRGQLAAKLKEVIVDEQNGVVRLYAPSDQLEAIRGFLSQHGYRADKEIEIRFPSLQPMRTDDQTSAFPSTDEVLWPQKHEMKVREFHFDRTKPGVAAELVRRAFPNLTIVADETNHAIIVFATPNQLETIGGLVKLLEWRADATQKDQGRKVIVVGLKRGRAADIGAKLNAVVRDKAVSIEAADSTNALVIRAPQQIVGWIYRVAQQLDGLVPDPSADRLLHPGPMVDGPGPGVVSMLANPPNPVNDAAPHLGPANSRPRVAAAPLTLLASGSQIKVFRLHHAGAEEVSLFLRKLFPEAEATILADGADNAILVRAPEGIVSQVAAALAELDVRPASPSPTRAVPPATYFPPPATWGPTSPPEPVRNRQSNPTGLPAQRKPATFADSEARVAASSPEDRRNRRDAEGPALPPNVARLKQIFEECDQLARQTAAKIGELNRTVENSSAVPDAQAARLMNELRRQVAAAYAARQELQRAELGWLRQRLVHLEEQIARREPVKDQIMAHRIEDLLRPELQWEPATARADAGSPARAARVATTGANEPSQTDKERRNRDNLKELAIALRNYHDAYRSFPAAVAMGSVRNPYEGTTPRSWRIDILPFVGAADLYQQYRRGEPWDGPNNKKLIPLMPAVFRSPFDDPHSTNCAYFALVGPGTAFDQAQHRVKISDISDGTSNTILLVEAKRNIPWTKPDDILFNADKPNPDKPVPELGGFVPGKFAAAMADGSVHVFDRGEVRDMLKWMILRDDGKPIHVP